MARPSRFSPRSEALEALEARTVGRDELCESIVAGMTAAVRSGQARFELLLGPRGAGKSHLLGLVEGRLRNRLSDHAVVVGLPEELHPSSLVHLLAEILRSLPRDPEDGPVERQLAILAASPEDACDRAVSMIRATLRGLPLVIALENLDLVFAAIGRDGQLQLRAILQTERTWSIVASARSQVPAFSKESEPFFGTFVARMLEPLSAEGCRELLVRLACACGRDALAEELRTPAGLARVKTLRHVLGAYPRAMAFIFPHLHHERPEAVEEALHDLAEELTPYFQEQMSRLPPGQRPVAELLAERWTPLSVTEISNATFTHQATTSTHLRRLRQDAIVRCTKLGRECFYEISDPLFRIARAMKRDDLRARTFLRVLQAWYEAREPDAWGPGLGELSGFHEPSAAELGDYHETRFMPLLEGILHGKSHEVLSTLDRLEDDHPLRATLKAVALGCEGEHAQSLLELAAVGSRDAASTIGFVASFGELEDGHSEPLVVGLCTALHAIHEALGSEEGSPSSAVDALERVLRGVPNDARASATAIVLAAQVLPRLALARELALCWRIIEALQPNESEAWNAELASLVLRAWAVAEGTEAPLPTAVASAVEGSTHPLPRVARALAAFESEPLRALDELAACLGELRDVQLERAGIGDSTWWMVITASVLERPEERAPRQLFIGWLAARSPAARAMVSAAAVAGILHWVAFGRSLASMGSPGARDLLVALDLADAWRSMPAHPDLAYARLAAHERALVREIARAYGLDERHEALCRLCGVESP